MLGESKLFEAANAIHIIERVVYAVSKAPPASVRAKEVARHFLPVKGDGANQRLFSGCVMRPQIQHDRELGTADSIHVGRNCPWLFTLSRVLVKGAAIDMNGHARHR